MNKRRFIIENENKFKKVASVLKFNLIIFLKIMFERIKIVSRPVGFCSKKSGQCKTKQINRY